MPRALMSYSAARERDAADDKRREERELELADRTQKREGGAGHEDEDAREGRSPEQREGRGWFRHRRGLFIGSWSDMYGAGLGRSKSAGALDAKPPRGDAEGRLPQVAKRTSRRYRTPGNLVACTLGVLVSLCIYGVLQERLMTIPYGGGSGDDSPPPEFFRSSIFLVLMNRVVTVAVSATGIFLTGERFSPKGTPLELYAMIAFGNLVTTVCQYEVLKYLSFAASTLAKCAKIIPVMCWGRLILNKRYSAADFVSAFVVTAGCFIFVLDRGMLADRDPSHQSPWVGNANSTLGIGHGSGGDPGWRWHEHRESRLHDYGAMKDPVDATLAATVPGGSAAGDVQLARLGDVQLARLGEDPARLGEDPFEAITPNKFVDSLLPRGQLHQLALGVVIMVVYLGFDGFTSTFQQMLYRRYSTSILNQIFFTTCFSSCMSTAWLLTTDQVPGVIQFIKIHPECVQDIFTLSVSSAVSQFAISYTIFCFGAVTLASVMTFRQFISVVISCFLFGSPLTLAQWFGVCLVLAPVIQRIDIERRKPEVFRVDSVVGDLSLLAEREEERERLEREGKAGAKEEGSHHGFSSLFSRDRRDSYAESNVSSERQVSPGKWFSPRPSINMDDEDPELGKGK